MLEKQRKDELEKQLKYGKQVFEKNPNANPKYTAREAEAVQAYKESLSTEEQKQQAEQRNRAFFQNLLNSQSSAPGKTIGENAREAEREAERNTINAKIAVEREIERHPRAAEIKRERLAEREAERAHKTVLDYIQTKINESNAPIHNIPAKEQLELIKMSIETYLALNYLERPYVALNELGRPVGKLVDAKQRRKLMDDKYRVIQTKINESNALIHNIPAKQQLELIKMSIEIYTEQYDDINISPKSFLQIQEMPPKLKTQKKLAYVAGEDEGKLKAAQLKRIAPYYKTLVENLYSFKQLPSRGKGDPRFLVSNMILDGTPIGKLIATAIDIEQLEDLLDTYLKSKKLPDLTTIIDGIVAKKDKLMDPGQLQKYLVTNPGGTIDFESSAMTKREQKELAQEESKSQLSRGSIRSDTDKKQLKPTEQELEQKQQPVKSLNLERIRSTSRKSRKSNISKSDSFHTAGAISPDDIKQQLKKISDWENEEFETIKQEPKRSFTPRAIYDSDAFKMELLAADQELGTNIFADATGLQSQHAPVQAVLESIQDTTEITHINRHRNPKAMTNFKLLVERVAITYEYRALRYSMDAFKDFTGERAKYEKGRMNQLEMMDKQSLTYMPQGMQQIHNVVQGTIGTLQEDTNLAGTTGIENQKPEQLIISEPIIADQIVQIDHRTLKIIDQRLQEIIIDKSSSMEAKNKAREMQFKYQQAYKQAFGALNKNTITKQMNKSIEKARESAEQAKQDIENPRPIQAQNDRDAATDMAVFKGDNGTETQPRQISERPALSLLDAIETQSRQSYQDELSSQYSLNESQVSIFNQIATDQLVIYRNYDFIIPQGRTARIPNRRAEQMALAAEQEMLANIPQHAAILPANPNQVILGQIPAQRAQRRRIRKTERDKKESEKAYLHTSKMAAQTHIGQSIDHEYATAEGLQGAHKKKHPIHEPLLPPQGVQAAANQGDQAARAVISLYGFFNFMGQAAEYISKIAGDMSSTDLASYKKQTSIFTTSIVKKEPGKFQLAPNSMYKIRDCC